MIRLSQIEWPQNWAINRPLTLSIAWPTDWSVVGVSAWFSERTPIEQVDFGNGRAVSAADLLDGHFQRLATQPVPQSLSGAHELHTTIAVVAPTLTPLTDLAEEVAHTLPVAQPTPQFRDTLYKALEQTHRQHHAQRILGTRPTVVENNEVHSWLVIGVVFTIAGIFLMLYKRRRLPVSHN